MAWLLGVLPIAVAGLPSVIAATKGRWAWSVPGLVAFEVGYVGVLLDDQGGSGSQLHLVWLAAVVLLALGLTPNPRPASWWQDRYGVQSILGRMVAAAPTIVLVGAFIVGSSQSSLGAAAQVGLLVGAGSLVLVPVGLCLGALISRTRRVQALAVMSSALALLIISLLAAWQTDAWAFGF